jgi:hypothetical protein
MEGLSTLSQADRQLLIDAGVEAYAKSDGTGEVLMVPKAQVARAKKALRASPQLFPEEIVLACPRCDAKDPAARRPYGLAILGVGIVVGIAAAGLGHRGIGLAAMTIGVATAGAVETRIPRWRCMACGARYTTETGWRFDG